MITTLKDDEQHQHSNGGGWVANTAKVDKSVYVGPHALVYGQAELTGKVRVEGTAQVSGKAQLSGNAVVAGNAWVDGNTKVSTGRIDKNDRVQAKQERLR